MTIEWAERPPEVANILNPAFTGAVLRCAVSGFVREAETGMPYSLAFLVFPFALHEATRRRLPRAVSTLLHTWLQENRDVVVQFPERARSLVAFTKEAIIFACQRGILTIDDEGALRPGDTSLTRVAPFKAASIDIKDTLNRADFVGRWFALSGTPVTLLTLLGVRP